MKRARQVFLRSRLLDCGEGKGCQWDGVEGLCERENVDKPVYGSQPDAVNLLIIITTLIYCDFR